MNLLPSTEDTSMTQAVEDPNDPLGIRLSHRIREKAVQQFVEGTARRREELAEKSNTRLAAEQLQLQNGDLVEFYRKPQHKDSPGWRGPARVIDCTPETTQHGTIGLNWQGRPLTVRIADLRRALVYACFMWHHFYGERNDTPVNILREFA